MTLNIGEKLALLKHVLENPASYLNDTKLSPLALALQKTDDNTIALNIERKSYQIYGAEAIEDGALAQMETAMKLPVTIAGALMPDAHQGYGLPIGGVLATRNAVIPFGVGVDIGCRMCMTLYDLPSNVLGEKERGFLENVDQQHQVRTSNFQTAKGPCDNGARRIQRTKHRKRNERPCVATTGIIRRW